MNFFVYFYMIKIFCLFYFIIIEYIKVIFCGFSDYFWKENGWEYDLVID